MSDALSQELRFQASIADFASAIETGDKGMRVHFDIPQTEMRQGTKLIAMRGKAIKLTVAVENNTEDLVLRARLPNTKRTIKAGGDGMRFIVAIDEEDVLGATVLLELKRTRLHLTIQAVEEEEGGGTTTAPRRRSLKQRDATSDPGV